MIGSVSATVAGVPCLFTLSADGIWEVDRAGDVPDDALDRTMKQLIRIVETTRPDGPDPIQRAAEALDGIPYVVPKAPAPATPAPDPPGPREASEPVTPPESPAPTGDPAAEAAFAEMRRMSLSL